MTHIETPRLILRPICSEDTDAFMRFVNEETYLNFMPFGPCTAEEMRTNLEKEVAEYSQSPITSWSFSIIEKATHLLVGSIKLWRDKTIAQDGTAKIGYGLDPAKWNQGLMTEAVKATTDFGHNKVLLHRI